MMELWVSREYLEHRCVTCRHQTSCIRISLQKCSVISQYLRDCAWVYCCACKHLNPFQGDNGIVGPPGKRGKPGRRGRRGPMGDWKVGILQMEDKCDMDNTGLLRFNNTSLMFCDGQDWKVS